jgi:BirA family biotin operon repressor/biotin-[acetyl-CoA-carboxylase] ligase
VFAERKRKFNSNFALVFYFFDELTSTIDEAGDPKYGDGDVIVARYQTAGRGQRGRTWSSRAGENLMFSVVLDTSFLRVTEQFLLLQTVALALTDIFSDYGLDARIKWTNDIYVGDCKITGVLIDHSSAGERLVRSGVGIGINVNQTTFEEWLPNPTSMAREVGHTLDTGEVLERFYTRLTGRLGQLKRGERERISRDYHSRIYRLDTPARYALPDGTEFRGTIRGVQPSGELILDDGTTLRNFLYREVSFII